MGMWDMMTRTRLPVLPTLSALLVAAFALLGPTAAKASIYFNITVSGTEYRLGLVGLGDTGTPSFDQADDDLNWMVPFQKTPWYNDATLASDIARGIAFESATTGISYRAVYNGPSGGSVYDYRWSEDGVTSGDRRRYQFGEAVDTGTTAHYFITQVPEIDGPVLAQAVFVLGALYLLLRGQVARRRADII